MDKNTKMYLGIGVTAIVIYLIWKNRQQFGGSVDVQTPIGGVRASVGGGQVSVGVNPAPYMPTVTDTGQPMPTVMNGGGGMVFPAVMNGGMVLPDGTLLEQAI